MPGRASARWRCSIAEADTTTTKSQAHDAAAIARMNGNKAAPRCRGQRMQNRLEPPQRNRIGKDAFSQKLPIDCTAGFNARKRRGDGCYTCAAGGKQRMDCRIGIVDGDAQSAQQFGGRRFAHRDRTRKPEDAHGDR